MSVLIGNGTSGDVTKNFSKARESRDSMNYLDLLSNDTGGGELRCSRTRESTDSFNYLDLLSSGEGVQSPDRTGHNRLTDSNFGKNADYLYPKDGTGRLPQSPNDEYLYPMDGTGRAGDAQCGYDNTGCARVEQPDSPNQYTYDDTLCQRRRPSAMNGAIQGDALKKMNGRSLPTPPPEELKVPPLQQLLALSQTSTYTEDYRQLLAGNVGQDCAGRDRKIATGATCCRRRTVLLVVCGLMFSMGCFVAGYYFATKYNLFEQKEPDKIKSYLCVEMRYSNTSEAANLTASILIKVDRALQNSILRSFYPPNSTTDQGCQSSPDRSKMCTLLVNLRLDYGESVGVDCLARSIISPVLAAAGASPDCVILTNEACRPSNNCADSRNVTATAPQRHSDVTTEST